ncbi:MAG TPA: acyl-CoA dehydrogenase family protein [Streptosporangiaceae bacterium]|nr:acyl-CoA dehydrogenase family protein [Streptosporangiaceae bacterium]
MAPVLSSLSPSEEHIALAETVREFVTERAPISWVRERMGQPGFDAGVHRAMAQDLGLNGLAIPEEYGGAGYGLGEQFVVLEELGRGLYPGPYLASAILAPTALLLAADEAACADYLPGLADGSATATLIDAGPDSWRSQPLSAAVTASGPTVTGEASLVLDGTTADLLLIGMDVDGKPSLVAITPDGGGVTSTVSSVLDKTRPLSTVNFDSAPARLIGAPGDAARYAGRLRAITASALAAESTGAAARCLDTTVDYLKVRVQFERPIGSFQALKHRCADMLVRLEAARSAVAYASWAIAEDSDEFEVAAAVAAATCAESFLYIAQQMIQLHGGIGFTWEHDAHLFLRRARSSAALFGEPAEHLRQLSALAGI